MVWSRRSGGRGWRLMSLGFRMGSVYVSFSFAFAFTLRFYGFTTVFRISSGLDVLTFLGLAGHNEPVALKVQDFIEEVVKVQAL